MFRLLHLPLVAYKLVMMWADHKSLQVDDCFIAESKRDDFLAWWISSAIRQRRIELV